MSDRLIAAAWSTGEPQQALLNAVPYMQAFGHMDCGVYAEVTVGEATVDNYALFGSVDFTELCIVSELAAHTGAEDKVAVSRTGRDKCGRCWRHRPEVPEDGDLCARCDEVVNGGR